MKQCVIPSEPAAGRRVIDELLADLATCAWGEQDVFGIHLAVEEAVVNAIKHGNQYAPDKQVRVEYQLGRDRFRIEVTDEGVGFDPEAVPDPTADENLEIPSGRGLMLMRTFMSHVAYNERGNSVVMEKTRNEG